MKKQRKKVFRPFPDKELDQMYGEALFRYIAKIPRPKVSASTAALKRNRLVSSDATTGLFDRFKLLTPKEQSQFLSMLASISTAEMAQRFVATLDESEKYRFIEFELSGLGNRIVPMLLELTVRVTKELPEATVSELVSELDLRSEQMMANAVSAITGSELDKRKKERDRQSDPKTIRRNVEICNLRLDPKEWSQGKLARKFDITPSAIRKILADEPKWRRLFAGLSTD